MDTKNSTLVTTAAKPGNLEQKLIIVDIIRHVIQEGIYHLGVWLHIFKIITEDLSFWAVRQQNFVQSISYKL